MGRLVNATPRPLYPRERDPVPIYRRLAGPKSLSVRIRKICPPPEFPSRPFQPVALGYNEELRNAYCQPDTCGLWSVGCWDGRYIWHTEIWGKYTQGYLGSMKRADNVWILTTDVKYVDILKRAWCNDTEWIHLAQEGAECSKWRTQGCTKNRDSAVGRATMLRAGRYRVLFPARAEILLFSKWAKPVFASHPVSCYINTQGTISGGKAAGVLGWSLISI